MKAETRPLHTRQLSRICGLAAVTALFERDLGGSSGCSSATIAAGDEVWSIPGRGRVQSLNVAAATAILIYLLTRS